MFPVASPLHFFLAPSPRVLLGVGFLVIAWPFVGVLIRYWANYTPKRIALPVGDEDGGESGTLESDLDSQRNEGYWSIFRRVKRVEGFGGFWKGLGVYVIFVVISVILTILIGIAGIAITRFFPTIRHTYLGLYFSLPLLAILSYLIVIPFIAILVRSIAISKKLWRPIKAYKALLNPFERRNPLRLCLLPGLAFGIIISDVMKAALSFPGGLWMPQPSQTTFIHIHSILLGIIMALAVTPIHVAITRLALQERTAPLPQTLIGEENNPLVDPGIALPTDQEAERVGAEEDVINIRSGQEPYKGLIDCMKSISKEEGLSTLWRGWYLSAVYYISPEIFYWVNEVLSRKGILTFLAG